MAKEELIKVVRDLLRDATRARFEGAAYARLSRVHGYTDGYMAALLDAGVIEQRTLLDVVSEERHRLAEAPALAQ